MFNRLLTKLNKEDGYVLLSAFIVLLVLISLSAVYVSISLSEVKQAENHENKVQAYYYARSGLEKAFPKISEGLENENLNGFDDFSWDMNNSVHPSDNKEKVNVDIRLIGENLKLNESEFDINDIEKIVVNSTGRINDISVNEKANYILYPPSSYSPPPAGDYEDSPVPIQDKDWVNGNSGNIKDTGGSIEGSAEESVVFRGPGNSLKLNKDMAKFRASTFYFDDEGRGNGPQKPIQIKKGSTLKLYSNTIIFYIDIEMGTHKKKEDGKLCLNTAEANSTSRGVVYFAKGAKSGRNPLYDKNDDLLKGAYTFPNEGACLPEDKDLLIPNQGDYSKINNWDLIWK